MTALLSCPFCGEAHHKIMGGANVEKLWWIKCQSCNAEGPTETTEAAAISAWNRRADDWQPIDDRAKDGRPAVLFTPMNPINCPGGMIWISGGYGKAVINPNEWRGQRGFDDPTHWRPLPKGPGG